MDIRGTIRIGKSPKGTGMILGLLTEIDYMLPDLPSHSSLMSIRVANVQLLAEVLCLSLRSAQGSKCSGSHVRPSVSCVSPTVLKVLLHLGGWGWEEGVPSKADHVEFKFRPTCQGVWT